MFPCGGSSVELLSRLLKRLDEAKLLTGSGGAAPPSDGAAPPSEAPAAPSDAAAAPADAPADPADAIAKDKIRQAFDEIKKSLVDLQRDLGRDKRREDKVLEELQVVARNVDGILTRARDTKQKPAGETDSEAGETDSSGLLKQLEEIKETINKATSLKEEDQEAERKAEEDVSEEEVDVQYSLERKIEESSAWSHLKLVVDSFETQLKQCLFCLTVFPPNAIIKKRLLFHWWMGEGIITRPTQGNKCFDNLISKGFIIPIEEKHCPKRHYCKIQTWIRRLLIAVAKSNAFLEYDPDSFPSVDYSRCRRACLRLKRPLKGLEDDYGNRHLKTIYNISKRYIDLADEFLINKGALTTMQLGRWKEQEEEVKKHHIEVRSDAFLDGLGNCRNMSYISLRGVSRIEKLPDQFDKLTKLVVLDLRACHNLEKLPKSVGDAKNLQYLDISECYLLDQIPRRLSNLSELQVFKGFIVGDYVNQSLFQVSDLVKLTKLRKLNISTGREFRYVELEALSKLKLTSLTIIWAVIQEKKPAEEEEQKSGPSPDKETTEQLIDDGNKGIQKQKDEAQNPEEHSTDADRIQALSTTVDDKKPSTARVSPTIDADEKKSDQVSSQKATPSEPHRVERKKVQLPDQTAKAVEESSTTTGQAKSHRSDSIKPVPPSKLAATTMTRRMTPDPPSKVIPESVQKLDLQCYNKELFPIWITPEKLPNLEKLYIRGGRLRSLGDGKDWKVKVLRVRFLEYLDDDWGKLQSSFPKLTCVEKYRCKKLESWPCNEVDHEDYPRYWFKKEDRRAEMVIPPIVD